MAQKKLKQARAKHGYRNIQFVHVKGHSECTRNDRADTLAGEGMRALVQTDLHRRPNGRMEPHPGIT